ncbi:sporulation histidine kinase inhibitor Sda [Bacillus sp. NEB1478]|nr:sporulation histidine kinase inhibitor Sda [Bacillus sp. NEB1478]WNB93031.1 sporulation histidine kinase inhibitor Sda [Bacillus sp. NEB1478]
MNKIMSDEQLIISYREVLKHEKNSEIAKHLKEEINRRGLKPVIN